MIRERVANGQVVIERWDRVFNAVSAEPRRQLIVSLLDAPSGHSVPLPESAANPNVPSDTKSLRRELLHSHLPMLADDEYIDYQTDPFVASRGPQFDEVAVVFTALYDNATDIPDSLVTGCQRLEKEGHDGFSESLEDRS